MGLFSEQIITRINSDKEALSEALYRLASVVMGNKARINAPSEREISKNAMEEILRYYHIAPAELPEGIKKLEDQLDFFMRPYGVMRRTVLLTGEWYRDSIGPLLGKTNDNKLIALIPGKISGYTFYHYALGRHIRVTKKNCSEINPYAFCFYTPLPARRLGISDLFMFMARSLTVWDYTAIAASVLSVVLLGLFTPYAILQLFDGLARSAGTLERASAAALLLGATLSAFLMGITKNQVMAKIAAKIEISTQSAAMARMLSLPVSFFNTSGAYENTNRLHNLSLLSGILTQAVLGVGLMGLFSFLYIVQVAVITPGLALPSLVILLLILIFSTAGNVVSGKTVTKHRDSDTQLSGFTYSLFSGIQKIKLVGGEYRAFAKWSEKYARKARIIYAQPVFSRILALLPGAVSLIGAVVLFAQAGRSGVSAAGYMAFYAAYGMVSAAVMSLNDVVQKLSSAGPMIEAINPLLNAVPEMSAGKKTVTRLSGAIELNNVTFRYSQDMPPVLEDLTLKIKPGQYIAIVGASGCGKSTLLKLLLGFEQPERGAIYYDRYATASVDLISLRKHVGTVMQNGRLIFGSIYQNIMGPDTGITPEQAWEAALIAGVAEDIQAMPMGMGTIIGEGGGGVSGGQRQRILIARAVATKPKILLFDEATSALDNITQKHVSESIGRLKCTRIIIAHRLSTIRQCDRVIVLDKGKIAEDGAYDELMARGGLFSALVSRQRMDA